MTLISTIDWTKQWGKMLADLQATYDQHPLRHRENAITYLQKMSLTEAETYNEILNAEAIEIGIQWRELIALLHNHTLSTRDLDRILTLLRKYTRLYKCYERETGYEVYAFNYFPSPDREAGVFFEWIRTIDERGRQWIYWHDWEREQPEYLSTDIDNSSIYYRTCVYS